MIYKDDICDNFYVVKEGKLSLCLILDQEEDNIKHISEVLPGAYLNDLVLLHPQPFAYNLVAVENSKVLVLRQEDFEMCRRIYAMEQNQKILKLVKRIKIFEGKSTILIDRS